jgi:hypothetical protein
MPLGLRDLQGAFAAHILGAENAHLQQQIVSDSIPAAARLRVYRHHVRESLSAALAATFPTVQTLVGPPFFRRLARDFVDHSLPVQPVLSEYGEGLAAFIAGYQPAHGLPYLADAARLDWALNIAFHARPADSLSATALSAIPVEQLPSRSLALVGGASLLRSPYPLEHIWKACQSGAEIDTVDLNRGGCNLLVLRRQDDAAFVSLAAGETAFLAALVDGRVLEAAAGEAFQVDPAFDLSSSFARLLALQAFAALQ